MSSPSSPTLSEGIIEELVTSPTEKHTMTVAMIKNHALDHRFEIETHILQAGFEIVKERQLDFDIETDPDTMFELFGEEYVCFAEGPVWVYVLERVDAVLAFHDLMGHPDPEIARQEAPSSLRALYGISHSQNAVMGSPDDHSAEQQILSIFASSPPFPTTDLPEVSDSSVPASDGSLNCEYQAMSPTSEPRHEHAASERSSETRSSTVNGHLSSNGKHTFRARPVPATNDKPDIVPRMSRAAALRTGVDVEATKPKHYPATAESLAKTFAGVPGHKRAETIHVASTEPPVVAPRMTRATSLRLGLEVPSTPKHRSSNGADSHTFDGVPGHKRRESIAVASTKPPTIAPRTNRSATLRVHKEAAPPPSSFNIRSPDSFSRSSSRTSHNAPSTRPPSAASTGRTSVSRASSSHAAPRSNSALALKPSNGVNVNGSSSKAAAASKPKPRPSVVTAPPSIAPRTNKSAELRAAKMANGGQSNGVNGTISKAKAVVKKIAISRAAKPIAV